MIDIILSIKPCFTNEIYQGNKPVELRKRIGNEFKAGAKLYIYSSSPQKAISGHALIHKIETLPISQIKEQYLEVACISAHAFDDYYRGHESGILIWLRDIVRYTTALPLAQLKKKGFTAPQSFCYVSSAIRPLLKDLK